MEKSKEEANSGAVPAKKQRMIWVDQIYSRKDRQVHFVKMKKPGKPSEKFNKTVLFIRRIISNKGIVASVEVDIKSEALKVILDEIFEGVDGLRLNKTPPVAEPELLFHAWEELRKRQKILESSPARDENTINDINAVSDFLNEHFGDSIGNLKSLSQHGEITYNLVWALFSPNSLVYTQANTLQAQQVFYFRDGKYQQLSTGENYFELTGRIINHDGIDFGYGDMYIKIQEFAGAKKVQSLTAYPLAAHTNEKLVREQLIERGRRFAQLVTPSCKEYTGMSIRQEQNPDGSAKEILAEATGRVVIDPGAFRLYKPNWWKLMDPWVATIVPTEGLTPDQLLICSHRVLGFSLSNKEWGAFAVSGLQDVVWDEDAFKKLIIEPKRRDLICSLVKSHRSDQNGFDDIIRNKGKGLVGLLSGGPGVGKTLTAEVVAELTHKPLYMISAGELGTELEKVDERLQMVLDITRRWSCVLLIDEADVYLQERSNLDLLRNALVSIFLRRLEYFQGILIMTTNRRQAIDPAFQSRIHFKINYPALTEESRGQVWKDFLSTIPSEIGKLSLGDESIARLAQIPMNGREIKNTISCAVAMARESKEPLTVERLQEVLSILVDEESFED